VTRSNQFWNRIWRKTGCNLQK